MDFIFRLVCLIGMGALPLWLGWIALSMGFQDLRGYRRARSWKHADATLHSDYRGGYYTFEIRGRHYKGRRADFTGTEVEPPSGSDKHATTRILYDPGNPDESVMMTASWLPGLTNLLWGTLLMVSGAFMMFIAIWWWDNSDGDARDHPPRWEWRHYR